jgi:hypothetical protein
MSSLINENIDSVLGKLGDTRKLENEEMELEEKMKSGKKSEKDGKDSIEIEHECTGGILPISLFENSNW